MSSLFSRADARRSGRRRALRVFIPAVGAAALTVTLAACGSSGKSSQTTSSGPSGSSTGAGAASTGPASSTPAAPTSTAPAKKLINVRTINSDGAEYGVGMPVIAYFPVKITDAKQWQADTKVTVNGKAIKAAWYFEPTTVEHEYYEAHLRPAPGVGTGGFWPAHSTIHVTFPKAGTPLGGDYAADGKLSSLTYTTGPANISLVNNATHTITVTSDGKVKYTFPVSLGATNTPTLQGTKIIMEKGLDIRMTGPGYDDPHVKYTQRLTYGGEYLHSAPWNCLGSAGCIGPANNIGHANSSNGCTNLTPTDAITLYKFLRVGDVVEFPNATGPKMQMGQGYGDYNVSWSQWLTGGSVPTE